ncbi:MAG: hypothetical protein ABW278_03985 [Steroidobacteraceae bacterium]
MRSLDFSSWSALLSTLLGLVLITIVMVGIRLMVMQTVQARRERDNRQVNERLKTLIAAYKTLGGSFTGELAVDPTHLRDLQRRAPAQPGSGEGAASSERSRRIRDAVEGALSDVILLGTEEQVKLAAHAAADLVAGRPTRTDQLVVSLRDFIRKVLDLEAVPRDLPIPVQGPARQMTASKGRGNAESGERGAGGRAGGGGGGGMGGVRDDAAHHDDNP